MSIESKQDFCLRNPSYPNVGKKRTLNDEKSGYLWHKRLGHASKSKIDKL